MGAHTRRHTHSPVAWWTPASEVSEASSERPRDRSSIFLSRRLMLFFLAPCRWCLSELNQLMRCATPHAHLSSGLLTDAHSISDRVARRAGRRVSSDVRRRGAVSQRAARQRELGNHPHHVRPRMANTMYTTMYCHKRAAPVTRLNEERRAVSGLLLRDFIPDGQPAWSTVARLCGTFGWRHARRRWHDCCSATHGPEGRNLAQRKDQQLS